MGFLFLSSFLFGIFWYILRWDIGVEAVYLGWCSRIGFLVYVVLGVSVLQMICNMFRIDVLPLAVVRARET